MTGYVRQSAADIVPTAVVRAAPINNEYNALRDAFNATSGHKHDGTAAEGHPVPVIGDVDLLNKIATDTTNNRHGVFVEVAAAAVEQVRFQDGAIVPVTDNDIDLGTSALEFKNLYITGVANIDSLVADTADINGGTVDASVVGATTPAAGTFTNLTANTSLVAATADINAGTIDGAVIGGSSALAITGTTVTATTGFVGGLTGAVTGNTAGTHTGAVVGNVTGDLTGNVTASTGTSSFNDVTINGGLNMNAGTAATITNLTSPTNTNDAATKGYVDTSISNLVASAPSTLDTLNEIATALGNDANLSTTLTNSIATKLALAGGTMSGAIAMGTSKITGLGNPTANQDAATKTYVDTADALKLSLTGGTMSGAIAMGTSKITGLGDPTANQDATTKIYVDGILGSATAAAASASAAATSASNAATSASNASTSASNASSSASAASTSATNAAASYDSFDDRYLGSKTSAPSVDNDGNTLLTGALYWNSTSNELYLWTGSAWTRSALSGTDYVAKSGDTMTGALTTTALTLSGGTANGVTYLNGSKVLTSGSALVFDGTNLGVGTASPTIGVDVQNTGALTAALSATRFTTAGASSYLYLSASRSATVGINTALQSGDSMGIVRFSGADGTTYKSSADIRGSVDGTVSTGVVPGRLSFYTNSNGTLNENMRLDSSGNLLVGTTTNNGGVRGMFSNGANGLPVTSGTTQTYGALRLRGGDNAVLDFGLNSTDTWIQATDLANLANTYSLLLNPRGGNVGIGATSVDSLFVVGAGTASTYTDVQIKGASTSNYGPYQAWLSAGTKILEIASYGRVMGGTSTNSFVTTVGALDLIFGTNRTEGMRLTSTGLGIGTTSISNRLEVNGNARFYTAANGDLSITHSSLVTTLMAAGSINLAFGTNNTEKMRLDTSGNLLLGVTSSTGLSGTGDFAMPNNRAIRFRNAANSAYLNALYVDGSNNLQLGAGTSDAIISVTGLGEAMRIASTTGNVGIGTTSPAAKFDLIGDYKEGVITANTTTAYTISLSTGTFQILTLTGNCTFTFPTATSGKSFMILLKQDATGSRTATWPASVKWPGGTAPTITSTASKGDKFVFSADGTYWWGSNAGQNYL